MAFLFGAFDREPARMRELDRLLVEFGNAQFECGEFDGGGEDYDALCRRADIAKQAVINYVRELRASPLPQLPPSSEGK